MFSASDRYRIALESPYPSTPWAIGVASYFHSNLDLRELSNMNVAVIMSIYFAESPENFLRAMQSIRSQEVGAGINIRVYLGVDGKVLPDLETAIRLHQDKIYKLFWYENNRGLAPVLNDLIASVEDEEYVFRMDTDDVSYPQRFKKQIDYLTLNPAVDILGTSVVEFDESTNERRIVHFAREGAKDSKTAICRGVPVAHATVCFRRRVFETVNRYPLVRYNEDIALWFECLKNNLVIGNLREPLYEYTVGTDFFRRRGLEKSLSELSVYCRGIWDLRGLTWDYFFPIARFMLRISPKSVQGFAYRKRYQIRDIEAL